MREPPDRTALTFKIDKTKTLNNITYGPKYLLMKRINSNDSLHGVSPFLIKKVIDTASGGIVDACNKLSNGTLLIKTKNLSQATQLIQLTTLNNTIEVDVTEHNSLNYTKGVIYCNDLRDISETDILTELKSQNVVEVRKIMKKAQDTLIESGLITLKFASLELPTHINIGYQRTAIRPFIPLPRRCFNCGRLGHSTTHCKANKLCLTCGYPSHIDSESDEQCKNLNCCINCKEDNNLKYHHSIFDRQCPTYIKQKEIQAIRVIEKTDMKQANIIYNERYKNKSQSYSTISKTKQQTTRDSISYGDLDLSSPTATASTSGTSKQLLAQSGPESQPTTSTILTRNTDKAQSILSEKISGNLKTHLLSHTIPNSKEKNISKYKINKTKTETNLNKKSKIERDISPSQQHLSPEHTDAEMISD